MMLRTASLMPGSTSSDVTPTTVVCMVCTTSPAASVNVLVTVIRSRPAMRRIDDSSTSVVSSSPATIGRCCSKTCSVCT
ncbi:Uncharacterised protein [Mycobacteroides abscessus subsp. abscessus]|nr:Uncharacterised protein [Mycobacteroides abscessus subsp. abscessus]